MKHDSHRAPKSGDGYQAIAILRPTAKNYLSDKL